MAKKNQAPNFAFITSASLSMLIWCIISLFTSPIHFGFIFGAWLSIYSAVQCLAKKEEDEQQKLWWLSFRFMFITLCLLVHICLLDSLQFNLIKALSLATTSNGQMVTLISSRHLKICNLNFSLIIKNWLNNLCKDFFALNKQSLPSPEHFGQH